ncbi:mitochondrial carrier [Roridomyces roridus]|uniref:Mitochondrial carrier n=1 Tax=Roridomyces roridus TaxID=1738132 RepID=A0AAD7FRC0_9AGAR|nr:mitochondrial carrier [Roridomyces roridus]
MGESSKDTIKTGRKIFQDSDSGPEDRPLISRLRSDTPRTFDEFKASEGRDVRKRRLKELWAQLAVLHANRTPPAQTIDSGLDLESAQRLSQMYEQELVRKCGGPSSSTMTGIGWKEFVSFAKEKEKELWQVFHNELDLDGNGRLDAQELTLALDKVGIPLTKNKSEEFMHFLTASPNSSSIDFAQFRDFLILLPLRASPFEIYRYYEMRRALGDDARGAARVNMEGDVSLSAEDRPTIQLFKPDASSKADTPDPGFMQHQEEDHSEAVPEEEEEDSPTHIEGHTALKFLLAGGLAGAVSRTCTAPFDRLKIFLITRPPDLGGVPTKSNPGVGGARVIGNAIARIYAEGGVLAFWTGNGLSIAKIFPESAIKFFAYESSKRAFAKYFDHVDDPRDISGVSRFLSGGIGGLSSQLSIYPIETLKTQMMSNTGSSDPGPKLLIAARRLWALGGLRAYYRGLTIGLVGVFPYSAIDMSTFEALKLAYLRSTGKDEPGVLALLAFGSLSGSVGATSVYPLNLVRTRLQASGSTGHPQTYTGPMDVVHKTWQQGGWRSFYKGLAPTLAKVVPAVSISYVVYESSKRRLGVA